MANPFEVLAQFQLFREQSEAMLETTDPSWFMRAAVAKLLDWILQTVLEAGPPASFAESLSLDEAQARVLYTRVLRAAMLRQRELVLHGR
jgi:hypothetical protein